MHIRLYYHQSYSVTFARKIVPLAIILSPYDYSHKKFSPQYKHRAFQRSRVIFKYYFVYRAGCIAVANKVTPISIRAH